MATRLSSGIWKMKNKSPGILVKSFLLFFMLTGIFIFVFPQLVNTQTKNIRFKHLTVYDGLSHGWIHSIIQDKFGFIWIGTDDGLNRYDENTFRIYRNTIKNMYSISSNNIICVFEDSKGNLWIDTRQGLNLYDRENNRFLKNPRWPQIEVRTITEDKNNTL
jgi:ligand-binding sensor domain-containing protein